VLAECLQSACRVLAECLLSAYRVLAECLQSACRVLAECLQSACRVLAECLLSACRVLAECLQSACRVLAECLQSACRVLAECLQSACSTCKNTHRAQLVLTALGRPPGSSERICNDLSFFMPRPKQSRRRLRKLRHPTRDQSNCRGVIAATLVARHRPQGRQPRNLHHSPPRLM
jgi:hypothetical protein